MIKIAIPNKGRMSPEIRRLLEKIGLEVPENGGRLYANTNNPNIRIVYARAADIPFYVGSGTADVGITGEDMIRESGAIVEKLLKLNFGTCKIVVAAPNNSKIKTPADYRSGIRVATKLAKITKEYFNSKNIFAEVIQLSGATELAPNLGIADLIVDQTSTGTTLAVNNLEVIDVIFDSNPYLIANKKSLAEKQDEIDEIKVSIESVVTAEEKRYIIANVISDEDLEKVIAVMPAMESPTVSKLAKQGEYAIQSVVDSKDLMPTIRKLKQAGAKDILVMNMSRVVE